MVHRMLLVRVGSRYVHLLKMFGALFTFACAFFVLHAAFKLNQALMFAGASYPGSPAGDIFGVLTEPIASLFLWLSLLVVGLALYRSDRTILPLEEDIRDLPETSKHKKEKKGKEAKVLAPQETEAKVQQV